MSTRGEMWVGGSAAVIQFPGGAGLEFSAQHRMAQYNNVPWTDVTGYRDFDGAWFRGQGGNSNSFHFSIPTPAVLALPDIQGHVGITVDKVSVFFRTWHQNVHLNGVIVMDAADRSGTRQYVPLTVPTTSLSGQLDDGYHPGLNSFPLATPISMSVEAANCHGINVTVDVNFGQEGDLFFRAVGIHYHT